MSDTILIVEDNPLNAKLFRDLLEAHEYNVVETSDGNQVLGLIEHHNPALVIMDIQLPNISGIEVIKRIRQTIDKSKLPIIAVTAFVFDEDKSRILEAGCEEYMSKPINISNFVSTVQRLVA